MKLRKKIIIGVTIISMLGILLFMNKNGILYNKVEENTINELETGIAVYVANDTDYERVDSIPESGYTFNESLSYCNESEVKNENIKISYDMNTKMISITPVANEKTKCYLYFDQDTAIARDYILAQNTVNEGTPNFSTTATTNEGIYTAEDNDGTSYYYRGAVDNNYFYFGGYYWRIIRINGDGSIRLIYQGTSALTTGANSQIETSLFNTAANNNAYLGYMYELGVLHGTANSSIIKDALETWYSTNLLSYNEYINSDNGFCNDRNNSTSMTGEPDNSGGIGTTVSYYATRHRFYNLKSPSLRCTDTADLFTASISSNGNKALTYPIGLINSDEVMFAGGTFNGDANNKYYLYTGQDYWIMSPSHFSSNVAYSYNVTSTGTVYRSATNTSLGVRPVININKDVELEGTGTSSDPFKIKGTEIKELTASETILANITPKTTTPDFSQVATTDEGVYRVSDGMYGGYSYYWRGAVTNNYVTFANKCWRIIRINGDGSIRLIYDGATCHANGTSTTDSIAEYNASNDNSTYVGWSYTASTQHGTGTKSNARTQVENWYNSNLESYKDYIADGKYCNDRNVASGYTWASAPSSNFYYAAWERLQINKTPTLSCTNSSDVFTVKIGLITADEVSFAGGVWNTSNTSYYLYNGNYYWTMSPSHWYSTNSWAYVFTVHSPGYLSANNVGTGEIGLRPVINLNSNVTFSGGNGSQSTPYVVST